MSTDTITQKRVLEAAQEFHWATQEHFNFWLTGERKKKRKTEHILQRLVEKGDIFSSEFERRKVYAVKRRVRNPDHILKVAHGLGCTEGLVRFHWSKFTGYIFQERHFFGCGSIPEWGILYPDLGEMLLFEFSTKSDFNYSNKIKNKISAYRNNIGTIGARFNANPFIVMVLDVPREKVLKKAQELSPAGVRLYLVDYESFKKAPIGRQFDEPIYIWMEDGSVGPVFRNGH